MPTKRFSKKMQELEEEAKREAEERVEESGDDETNWLISYADLMTLLMGFFVLLYSMSKVDNHKYQQVREGIAKKFGGQFETIPDQMAQFVTQLVNETEISDKVEVRRDAVGVSVRFTSTLFFDTLSAEIKSEGRSVLDRLMEGIQKQESARDMKFNIVVEGHSDSRPVIGGAYPSNWELSAARAARVVRLFLGKGYEASRLTAIGYADKHPEVAEVRRSNGDWDEMALAKNRRVVIRILEPEVDFIPTPRGEKVAKPGPLKKLAKKLKERSQRKPAAVVPSEEMKKAPPKPAKPGVISTTPRMNPNMPKAADFPSLDR